MHVFCGTVAVRELGAAVSVSVRDTEGTMKRGFAADAFRFVPVGEARDVFGVDAATFARDRFA